MPSAGSVRDPEAAQKAFETAKRKHSNADDEGARRFLDKALRLDPSLSEQASDLQDWLTR